MRPLAPWIARLALLGSLFATPSALAREHNHGAWLTAGLKGPIGRSEDTRWNYVLHGEYRAYDAFDGLRYSVMRVGAGYRLDHGFSLLGGLDRHHSRLVAGGSLTEVRLWQAVQWKHRFDNDWSFSARARIEQRDFDKRDGTYWRFRTKLGLDIPFSTRDNLAWVLSVEPFFQVHNPNGSNAGMNQVRSFVGLNIDTGEHASVEVGYLNQYGRVRDGADIINHMLQVNLRFSQ
ncbi:DUF2490 domain-containing protein [Marinihelvus fidelis]|nr:DUF2490 domain-containing protein [Marinihelvus fidelis]